jgi:ABC-2 type transport system ATP-binding protein
MDVGTVIAKGSPDSLLKDHYDDVILQLPERDFPSSLSGIPHKSLPTQSLIEIATHDVNATIRQLTEHHAPLDHMTVRPRNLDDLFLDLTGKELRA